MSTSRTPRPRHAAPLAAALLLVAGASATAQTTPAPTPTLPAPGPPSAPSTPPAPTAPPAGTPTTTPGGPPSTTPASPATPSTGTPSTGAPSTGAPTTGVPLPATPSTNVPGVGAPGVLAAPAAGAAQPQGPLTLGGAARLAAVQSANSEAARYRIRQAQARVTQSRAALLPTLSALASQNQRTFNTASFGISFPSAPGQPPLFNPNGQVAGPVNIYDARARAAANLFDAAAIERLRAARTLVRAGSADADNQAQLAAAAAASAYLRVQRADALLLNRVADSALAAELVNIAQQQLAAGTGVILDVTRARAQLAATRAQLIGARGDRDRSRLDLARALGLAFDTPVTLADTLGAAAADAANPVPGGEDAAVRQALGRRADVRAAAEQLDAARRQTAAIRAEALPSVSAFVDDGNTGTGFKYLLNTYTYGVQVNVPIFDAGRRSGRVQEQRAATSELDVRRRDLEAQVTVDVRGALLDLRTAREQAVAARERLTLAEQEVAQARDRFRAGVAGSADVVTASQSLSAARTGYAEALTAQQSARIALARAQGAVTDLP